MCFVHDVLEHLRYPSALPHRVVQIICYSIHDIFKKILRVSIVCNSSTNRFIFLSDGSGLTGVFIALDLLLRQVLSKNSIDIRDVVLSLRNNRPQMVRTLVSKSIYWMRLNDKLYIHYFILKTYYKIQIIINDILAKLKSLAAWLMVN